jgi:hypothetical protein
MLAALLLRLTSLSTLLLLSQCDLASPQPAPLTLPAVTQKGANTIGFRVGETIWLPQGSPNFLPYKAYYKNQLLWFHTSRLMEGKLTTFGIYVRPTVGIGSYDLSERTGVGATYTETGPDDSYEVPRVGAGILHLTRLDSVKRVIAGTFDCELVSPTSGKQVQVTQGRFDLTY